MPIPSFAPDAVAGVPLGVVADRGECPDVAGRGDPVVLGSSGVDECRAAGGAGDRGGAGECLERARVREPVVVVADLGE